MSVCVHMRVHVCVSKGAMCVTLHPSLSVKSACVDESAELVGDSDNISKGQT